MKSKSLPEAIKTIKEGGFVVREQKGESHRCCRSIRFQWRDRESRLVFANGKIFEVVSYF